MSKNEFVKGGRRIIALVRRFVAFKKQKKDVHARYQVRTGDHWLIRHTLRTNVVHCSALTNTPVIATI